MPDYPTRLRSLPADTISALAFFSRVPAGEAPSSFDLRRVAAAWPIAGLLVALPPALLFLLARAVDFPGIVAALFALALYAALTGAMHEDGLADSFDGMGGATREDKLAIMRDSRLGTFGGLALFFVLLTKASALAVIGARPLSGAIALILSAMLSRSLALWHWSDTLPARRDGTAWSAGRPDWMALAIGLAIGLLAAVLLLIAFGLAALIAILMGAAAVGLWSSLTSKTLGGHTGDTVGAAQQMAEALLLAGISTAWATITV
jgi:adenosylcobinamide-GDP ribazoletransferase